MFVAGCQRADEVESARQTTQIFTDITDQVNLNFTHDPGVDGSYFMPEVMGSGGAFLDYDNDGDLDIYLVNGAGHGDKKAGGIRAQNRLFRQEPNGTFVDVTESSGLGDTGYGMGVAVGDIDNDGHVDVYIANYGADVLYRNNGNGTFTDISQEAGIRNQRWASSVVFFDYNGDDFLDIYVVNYIAYDPSVNCADRSGRPDYCGPDRFPGVPDVLYRNNGDGTFADMSDVAGVAKFFSKGLGVVSADFNADLYADLYVANDGEPNQLWINQQNGTFRNEAMILGTAVNELGHAEAGMGIAVGDVDNDGDFDLFISHLGTESNTLYRNAGAHGFHDDTASAGLGGPSIPYTGFGTGFMDYDHDGDLDLAVANGRVIRGTPLLNSDPAKHWDDYSEPNLLFENDGGRFHKVNDEKSGWSMIDNSRGLVFGDVDNDGDIDLLVVNDGGRARLLRNDVKKKGHWLVVGAIDPKLRRAAIGATITVVAGGRRLHRLVTRGYSYLSSNDPRAHFGLGLPDTVEQIIVEWPDGAKETFAGVKADQVVILRRSPIL